MAPLRQQILDRKGIKSDYIFIADTGRPWIPKHFHNTVRETWKRHGLYTGPLSIRSHGFRKFFEQEASPPERGVSKAYITFMMGHSEGKDSNGTRVTHALDAVGGTYDNAPKVYPNAVEKEYQKLEPYINIYTGKTPGALDLDPEDEETLKNLLKGLKTGNFVITKRTN